MADLTHENIANALRNAMSRAQVSEFRAPDGEPIREAGYDGTKLAQSVQTLIDILGEE